VDIKVQEPQPNMSRTFNRDDFLAPIEIQRMSRSEKVVGIKLLGRNKITI
jgi:hypothetical protein